MEQLFCTIRAMGMHIRFGMLRGWTLSVSCLLRIIKRRSPKYVLDLAELQEIRSEKRNIEPLEDFYIIIGKVYDNG
jgi:hypothetical protein